MLTHVLLSRALMKLQARPGPSYRLVNPKLLAKLMYAVETMDAMEVYRRWDDGFLVRRMRRAEGQQVVKWFGDIVRRPRDLEVALDMRGDNADVDGFYIGELNGEMVASLVDTQVSGPDVI